MSYAQCPPDVRPGDIVRCRSLAGLPPAAPLSLNHIYSIRANEALGDAEPFQGERAPVLHLHGIAGSYAPFRFEVVFRRTEEPQELHPLAVVMALHMQERAQLTGACTDLDLARAGFTAAQIREHADAARGIAGPVTETAAA